MKFFKDNVYIDFMKFRRANLIVSGLLFVISLALLVYPGPNLGIDFAGGTEVQLAFNDTVTASELRGALSGLGYVRPDVVSVAGRPNEYIVRVQETSAVRDVDAKSIRSKLTQSLQVEQVALEEIKFSPGGDKISLRLSSSVEPQVLQTKLESAGASVRTVHAFGQHSDHRYEAQLVGLADQLLKGLQSKLGAKAPSVPRRVEWVGPKAGEQLRDAAFKSLLYAIGFIMLYVAFRFDLRFAPGGVIAMVHDAVITVGIYVALRKEFNLTLVAAILTIVGYSINDTIVVYDRVRENMSRHKGRSLRDIVNISTSETLSRTIITGGTTLLSLTAFFVWGTPVIQDFSLALIIGILVGTYSSIYIAAPVTEWMDATFFRRARA
jgi:preprotein translocase subunit SecF